MYGVHKRQFHEWANSVSFENVLEESCTPTKEGIQCFHCGTDENVYMIEWKNSVDFLCIKCLRDFLANNIPDKNSDGFLRKRFLVFSRDEFKCVYCGRNPRDHNTTLEVEHVHPKAKGGTDSLDNLVTACRECNAGKSDFLLSERQKTIITKGRL